jgi:Tn3 transposase DDE domain
LSSSISKEGLSGNQRCQRAAKQIQIQSLSIASRLVLKVRRASSSLAISSAKRVSSQSRPRDARSSSMPKEHSLASNSSSVSRSASERSSLPAICLRYPASEAIALSAILFIATQEITMLTLHLLQISLVYINTLMIQRILGEPNWIQRMTPEDLRALTPLIYTHVTPYGTFRLDMSKRLDIDEVKATA